MSAMAQPMQHAHRLELGRSETLAVQPVNVAHSMQSGMASVAENVTARALGVKSQLRVIEGGKSSDVIGREARLRGLLPGPALETEHGYLRSADLGWYSGGSVSGRHCDFLRAVGCISDHSAADLLPPQLLAGGGVEGIKVATQVAKEQGLQSAAAGNGPSTAAGAAVPL